MLPAGPARPEGVRFNFFRPDFHFQFIGYFRNNIHRSEGSMPAPGSVKRRDPNQAMDSLFPAQIPEGVLSFNPKSSAFYPRLVSGKKFHDFCFKTAFFRPPGIHPQQHLSPILRLRPSGAGMNSQVNIAVVKFSL